MATPGLRYRSNVPQLVQPSGTALRLGPAAHVNVLEYPYGAKGDGVTDDSAAILAAIDAVSSAGGGHVFFPAATYLVGSGLAVAASNVGFRGTGPGSIIKASATNFSLFTLTANDCWWRDLAMYGASIDDNGGQYGITTSSAEASITGGGAGENFAAISSADSFTITLKDSTGTTVATQLVSFQNTDITYALCIARINSSFGPGKYYYTATQTVNGSNVPNGHIKLLGTTGGGLSSIQISGNAGTITRLGFVAAQTVNGTGTPALRARVEGCVFSGPDATHALNNGTKASQGCDGWVVTRNVFQRLAGTSGVTGAGYGSLFAKANDWKFTQNTFYGTALGGRHVVYPSHGAQDWLVQGNHVFDALSSGIHSYASLDQGTNARFTIADNLIVRNGIGETDTGAIEVSGTCVEGRVTGNVITDAAGHGIIIGTNAYAAGCVADIDVSGNRVTRTGLVGIHILGAVRTHVFDNRVLDASWPGGTGYHGIDVIHNSNNAAAIADSVTIENNYVYSSTPSAPTYQQAIRFEPSANGPTSSVCRNNVVDPGTGADGNNPVFTHQAAIAVMASNNLSRVRKTYTATATTPSVAGTDYIVIANAGPINITAFTFAHDGQVFTCKFSDANTTLVNGATLRLASGSNYNPGASATVTFRYDAIGGLSREISRAA